MKDRRFTVVELAGYVGENDGPSFSDWRQAQAYIESHYSRAERDPLSKESLHVDIRQDWTDSATGEEMSEYVY